MKSSVTKNDDDNNNNNSLQLVNTWLFFGASVVALVAAASVVDWEGDEPATCLADDSCWCEQTQSAAVAVRQPASSWSALAFTFAGSMIIGASLKNVQDVEKANSKSLDADSPLLVEAPAFGLAFGAAVYTMGFTAWIYHAGLTAFGQFVDGTSMGLLGVWFIVANAGRARLIEALKMPMAWGGGVALYAFLNIVYPPISRNLFLVTMALGLGLYLYGKYMLYPNHQASGSWMSIALGLVVLAHVVWFFDTFKILCEPESLLNGHAIWHFIGASATLPLYTFYLEEPAPLPPRSEAQLSAA